MDSRLAIRGGEQSVKGLIAKYNAIEKDDAIAAARAINMMPLSGFLGGNERGGHYVQRLEALWSAKFNVPHAIACNSATSGLLAACAVTGMGVGAKVLTSPFTMSATAAAPRVLRAKVVFGDIDPETFCLDIIRPDKYSAIIATNLFGHPARLSGLRALADHWGSILIEDNAQAPMAMENGVYAGTIGHMGVFSLNVHKHLQCGEGGVVVTHDPELALRIRRFINHGELAGDRVGLNLRMTEYTAAIAINQLRKIDDLVGGRVRQAQRIIKELDGLVPWLKIPKTRNGCTHVYYMLPFLLDLPESMNRETVIQALKAEGFPLEGGYVRPLYYNTAFGGADVNSCKVTEKLHAKTLMTFSNCEWSPNNEQVRQFADAIIKVDRLLVRDGERVNHA